MNFFSGIIYRAFQRSIRMGRLPLRVPAHYCVVISMTEFADREQYSVMPDVLSFGKLDVLMVAVVFLQSLLIAWFLFLIIEGFEITMFFRFLLGVAVIFAIMVPVFVLLDGFQTLSITDGFFIPLGLYTFMFALFNSLISYSFQFLNPGVLLPAVAGGIGFGLVGLGAYHLPRDLTKSFAAVTCGITIIFLSSPMILAGFFFILTGDLSSLPTVSA